MDAIDGIKHLLSEGSETLQKAPVQRGCLVEGLHLRHSLCCLVALTCLILEIITSSLQLSHFQASRGNVGALLPMRAAALACLASLCPEAPDRSGTMAPCGS